MDLITPERVVIESYNVCKEIQVNTRDAPPWSAVALLIGTAAAQTGFETKPLGSDLSVFGLQFPVVKSQYASLNPRTGFFNRSNKGREGAWNMFSKAWFGFSIPYVILSDKYLRHLLAHDVRFAATVCRWQYLDIYKPEGAEYTLTMLGATWDYVYSAYQKTEPHQFISAWTDCECGSLMALAGYR